MKPANRIFQAILFDVGWTLTFIEPERQEILGISLGKRGFIVRQDEIDAAHREASHYYEMHRWLPESVADLASFWRRYYQVLLGHLSIDSPDLPEAFYQEAKAGMRVQLYPETLPVLAELRRLGLKIGAVSNWSTDLPEKLESLGLLPFLDTLVVSDIVGFHKPQPQIFELALDSLQVPAEATLHVGDDWDADVEGARSVGITPVWLDRKRGTRRTDALCVHALVGLLPLVKDLPNELTQG